MCQTCSDREGRIVDLSENSCTKRFCEKKLAEDAENAENADNADDAEEANCDYAGRNDEPDEPEPDEDIEEHGWKIRNIQVDQTVVVNGGTQKLKGKAE